MEQEPMNEGQVTQVRPPIPSPIEVPDSTPSQVGNQVVVALCALVFGGLEWGLSGMVGMWPVGVLVLGSYFSVAIGGTLAVAQAGKAMGWRVRREDLPRVRRVVDLNMKGAYALMTMAWPFLLVALMRGQAFWAVPLMGFSIPFAVWSTGVEKKFKNMAAEPDVVGEYAALIAAWKEARFGLRKEISV